MSDQIIRNEYGDVVLISHPLRKVRSEAFTGETAVRFLPPLILGDDDVDESLRRLEAALARAGSGGGRR